MSIIDLEYEYIVYEILYIQIWWIVQARRRVFNFKEHNGFNVGREYNLCYPIWPISDYEQEHLLYTQY